MLLTLKFLLFILFFNLSFYYSKYLYYPHQEQLFEDLNTKILKSLAYDTERI